LDPPPHSTGGTVDLTLTFEGSALALGTAFDEFSPDAHARAFEDQPGLNCDLRRMLYWSMSHEGFVGIRTEWWHFEFGTVRWAARTGVSAIYGRGTSQLIAGRDPEPMVQNRTEHH
jgi:D-alanyl-D-alanine dipeptidase